MTCVHHWVLGEANGTPFVDSRCKKCGAERTERVGFSGDIVGEGGWDRIKMETWLRSKRERAPKTPRQRKPRAARPHRIKAERHGTYSCYVNNRCRRPECKAARLAYERNRGRRARAPWSHGTIYGYQVKKCRCEPCTAANTAAVARYRERRKAA